MDCVNDFRSDARQVAHSPSLYYLLKYPPTTSSIELAERASEPDVPPPPRGEGKGYHDGEGERNAEKSRVHASGAFVLCPAVEGAYRRLAGSELTTLQLRRLLVLISSSSCLQGACGLLRDPCLLRRLSAVSAGSSPFEYPTDSGGNVSDDPRVEADFFTDRELLCHTALQR